MRRCFCAHRRVADYRPERLPRLRVGVDFMEVFADAEVAAGPAVADLVAAACAAVRPTATLMPNPSWVTV